MKKINITTTCKNLPADLYTPVGIYLRMRDKFRDTILLESTDATAGENSQSIICINAIAGIEIFDYNRGELKYPNTNTEPFIIAPKEEVTDIVQNFMQSFQAKTPTNSVATIAQGLFGYLSYEALHFFDNSLLQINNIAINNNYIPLVRYRLYQYVIIINHYTDEILLCENNIDGVESKLQEVQNLLQSKDVPEYPFALNGNELSDINDQPYLENVQKGIQACKRGDVFQIVLSRSYIQGFTGDEFNVYRKLRSINPGPYLFYFDYGDYKLMGSSPESKLQIKEGVATLHPIAGTFKRTQNEQLDKDLALALQQDEKENAEHVMLVDLARNDLSKVCNDVQVSTFKKIKYYSHVIHLVSEVQGKISEMQHAFKILATVFPAGTLSGAPKHKAIQLISEIENNSRSFYGGAIGYIGFNNSCNHAIMIRTFLSKNNTLTYRAGAGVVAVSKPQLELEEVHNKLAALRKAIIAATKKL